MDVEGTAVFQQMHFERLTATIVISPEFVRRMGSILRLSSPASITQALFQ